MHAKLPFGGVMALSLRAAGYHREIISLWQSESRVETASQKEKPALRFYPQRRFGEA
jgi:hypothetical protein